MYIYKTQNMIFDGINLWTTEPSPSSNF